MFYNTVTTDLKPIDYFHRLVKLYCDKESNRVQYLLCCLNALIMVATVNLLRFGRTLSPASAIVMPWTMTWSMTVARISSVMMVRGCLALPPGPPPLPCWPPPLPCWPPPLPCWPPPLPCWPPPLPCWPPPLPCWPSPLPCWPSPLPCWPSPLPCWPPPLPCWPSPLPCWPPPLPCWPSPLPCWPPPLPCWPPPLPCWPPPLPCWPPPLPCWPPPLPCWPPPLPCWPPPLPCWPSPLPCWPPLQQTVHSELAFIHVVTALATSVFNFESLCVMNDARCVHCVQILLTVASILHHMSFHLRIWAEFFCNLCFSKEKCVKIYENGGLCFVNCVFMWNVFMILENDG